MSARTLVVLALAVVCGGTSAAGVYLLRGQAPKPKQETVAVVVAAREIARGEVVGAQSLTTREWPRGFEPPNAIADPEKIVNRTAMAAIMAGEPVLKGKIADADSGRGLAALIPAGHRAYTIKTSSVGSAVAGFVNPGNRVDVLLTLRGGSNDKTGGGSSTTLLQAVEILAVDQRLDVPAENRAEKLGSVTLLVTPEQATLLDLGHNMGTLTLALRNPGDVAKAETNPATVNLLRFSQEDPTFPDDAKPETKPNVGASSFLAAAATVAKAAVMTSFAATPAASPEVKEPTRRYIQTHTLRGRHSGRVVMRDGQW